MIAGFAWRSVAVSQMLVPTVALAEVCDKEVPSWNPADGPVGPVEGFFDYVVNPLGIALVLLIIAACVWRSRIVPAVAACLAFLWALSMFESWIDPGGWGDIIRYAVVEGCRTSPLPAVGTLTLLAAAMAALGALRTWRGLRQG